MLVIKMLHHILVLLLLLLPVKLFYQGNLVSLPAWFRYETKAKLNSRSMLKNFPNYAENEYEKHDFILDELNNLQFSH